MKEMTAGKLNVKMMTTRAEMGQVAAADSISAFEQQMDIM